MTPRAGTRASGTAATARRTTAILPPAPVRAYVSRVKVAVLTTSYPRSADDPAGRFVADAVEHLRARGVEVEVVSPASFRHFGLAYGHGIVGNIRARPWLALLVPAFLWSSAAPPRVPTPTSCMRTGWQRAPSRCRCGGPMSSRSGERTSSSRAVCRGSHARCCAARGSCSPHRLRWPTRRARSVRARCESSRAASRSRSTVGAPEEPPHVLFVGRLSAEKGILELVEAARGLPLRIVGDGPLRAQVPGAVGFVPPGALGPWYERAAVVAVPSRREGYGVVAREAMAWGRPVVAAAVGGLLDAVDDGETGLLVPPGDVAALRGALERLLADEGLRARLGTAARAKARSTLSFDAAADALLAVYEDALS